jgi:hypothetical protein
LADTESPGFKTAERPYVTIEAAEADDTQVFFVGYIQIALSVKNNRNRISESFDPRNLSPLFRA